MERVYDLKSTAAPLICLKVCLRLAAKNPPIKSAILSLKGQTCCLQQNQQREEDLGTGNEPFGVRVAQMYHETLGFSTLFTLLFTLAHKPTGNRLDFTSIHSLLGAPACKFGFPMDFPSCLSSFLFTVIESSVGPFWISMISKYRHLEHGGFHKPTWMPAWNGSLDRMGPGSCQLCQQCDALNANPPRRFSLGSNKAFLWLNTAFHTLPAHVEKMFIYHRKISELLDKGARLPGPCQGFF